MKEEMTVESESLHWNVDMEVNLFHAMRGHKPVGVNKHFQMISIHDKLSNSSHKKIASQDIWDHLIGMYDLPSLNESEIVPFPNREVEFILPDCDFGDLICKEFPRVPKANWANRLEEPQPNTPVSSKGSGKACSATFNTNKSSISTPDSSPKRKRTRQSQGQTPNSAANTPEAPPFKKKRSNCCTSQCRCKCHCPEPFCF